MTKTIGQQGVKACEDGVVVRVWCAEDNKFRLHEAKHVGRDFRQHIVVDMLDSVRDICMICIYMLLNSIHSTHSSIAMTASVFLITSAGSATLPCNTSTCNGRSRCRIKSETKGFVRVKLAFKVTSSMSTCKTY